MTIQTKLFPEPKPFLHRRAAGGVILTVALISGCTISRTNSSGDIVPYELANLDRTQSACVDFYQFASGGWLAAHPIPSDSDEWGTIAQLIDTNSRQIRQIIESAAAQTRDSSSSQQKVGDFYAACMDEAGIEAAGRQPVAAELQRIASIHDAESLLQEIASLQSAGVDAPFDVGSTQDSADAQAVILELAQGGLGLPEPGYYLSIDEKSLAIRDGYLRHVARLFELDGESAILAAKHAASVVAFETRLAAASLNRVQRRNPSFTTHRMRDDELRATAPSVPWTAYFHAIGIPEPPIINVAQPDFFRALDRAVSSTPLDDWKLYLRWQLLHRAAPELSSPFVAANFGFYSATLNGTSAQQPRWKRCGRSTDRALTRAVGQLYVQQYFSAADRQRATQMVDEIVLVLRGRVSSASWLGEETRLRALEKIDRIGRKVGYPDSFDVQSELEIDRTSHLLNVFRASRFEFARDLARVGRPLDRNDWKMSPQTPNASYQAGTNEIIIPAAVLQPPLWDPATDSAFNYGAIGALIGHELTHAFDDRGARFDAAGNLHDWWSPADLDEFNRRADCVARQFDTYVVGDVHENGKLVRGESIADLGGLTAAFEAYAAATRGQARRLIGGFTPEQRVFLGWARMWTANLRPEYARKMTLTNNHPIGRYRVNGTISNMPEFAAAFGCKAGDAMVRQPEQRCTAW
jgi:putative endopeptidase